MNWINYLLSLVLVAGYAAILSLVVFGAAYQMCRFVILRGQARLLWIIHVVALLIMTAVSYVIIQKDEGFQHPLVWPFFLICLLVYFVIYFRKAITLKKLPLGVPPISPNAASHPRMKISLQILGLLIVLLAVIFFGDKVVAHYKFVSCRPMDGLFNLSLEHNLSPFSPLSVVAVKMRYEGCGKFGPDLLVFSDPISGRSMNWRIDIE